jgi:hypothetical protein
MRVEGSQEQVRSSRARKHTLQNHIRHPLVLGGYPFNLSFASRLCKFISFCIHFSHAYISSEQLLNTFFQVKD